MPMSLSIPNATFNFGFRRSNSRMITFLLVDAKLAPRFKEIKDFPSPLILEVNNKTLLFCGLTYFSAERRALICSATIDLGLAVTISGSVSFDLEISASIETPVNLSISERFRTLTFKNSFDAITENGRKNPISRHVKYTIYFTGLTATLLLFASSMVRLSATVEASDKAVSSRFCSKKVNKLFFID